MAKMKAYVQHGALVPADWAMPVGATTHKQIDVLAYAETKSALASHVIALGENDRFADNLAKAMTLPSSRSTTQYGNAWEAFMAAYPPGPDTGPALFIASMHHRTDAPVLRVDDDGAFTIMGHWRTVRGSYMPIFERSTPTRR